MGKPLNVDGVTTSIAVPRAVPRADPRAADRKRYAGWLALGLGLILILQQSGEWAPGTDSALYLSLARNLAEGKGYVFNDLPVQAVPPGWPFLLAAASKLSPSFAFLGFLPALFLFGAAILWYLVLCRLAPPKLAFASTILSFSLFWGQQISTVLQSEASFCFFFAASLYLALRVREGRGGWGSVALLLVASAAMVCMRWVGVLAWCPVAGLLFCGRGAPAARRRWAGLLLSGVVLAGSLLAIRAALAPPPELAPGTASVAAAERLAAERFGGVDAYSLAPRFQASRVLGRLSRSGQWLSQLFWMPCKLLGPTVAGHATNLLGWALLLLFALSTWRTLREGQWFYAGALAFLAVLVYRWSGPNERYVFPLAPLFLVGVFQGLEILRQWGRLGTARLAPRLGKAIISTILVVNGSFLAVNIAVAHSSDFHATFFAGQADGLIRAAWYLRQLGVRDGEVAVSRAYQNLGRTRRNGFGARGLHLLLDRRVLIVPGTAGKRPPGKALEKWAGKRGVKFYLYRPPTVPWRLWHFRVPWVQEIISGERPTESRPFWQLWDLRGETPRLVDLVEGDPDWPRRVPGL